MADNSGTSRHTRHEQLREHAKKVLQQARDAAEKQGKDNYKITRQKLTEQLQKKFGHEPFDWQLDIAEAICLGLDTVLIAGTGAGKTIPFVLPLLLEEQSSIVIISPLTALQDDQVKRFLKMDISAVAVNDETWSPQLQKDLRSHKYRVILTSPEMSLRHAGFRSVLSDPKFSKYLIAYVVDECHCISQWGGEFRPTYRELSDLRAFVTEDIPILAASATLPQDALSETRRTLGIRAESSFFMNRGNYRANLHYSAFQMRSQTDFEALKRFFSKCIRFACDIAQTLIFTDNRMRTQEIGAYVRSLLPPELHGTVAFINALMSTETKRYIMDLFHKGIIRVLIATDAVGMGCDIPNIERVIQFGVPESLSVWIQRAGRAGRSANVKARAILLYEASAVKTCKRKQAKIAKRHTAKSQQPTVNASPGAEKPYEDDAAMADIALNGEGVVYQRNVEPSMRKWIETTDCRQMVTDDLFDNPPRPVLETRNMGDCCDNCDAKLMETSSGDDATSNALEADATKSRSMKRRRDDGDDHDGPPTKKTKATKKRNKQLQSDIADSLKEWRKNTKKAHYNTCSFSARGVLPDYIIDKIVPDASIVSLERLLEVCDGTWAFANAHAAEVVRILRWFDTAQERAAAAEREAKKQQEEMAKVQQMQQQELANAYYQQYVWWDRVRQEQELWRAQTEATRQPASKTLPQHDSSPHVAVTADPLVGSSTFNVSSNKPSSKQLGPPHVSVGLTRKNQHTSSPSTHAATIRSPTSRASTGRPAYARVGIPWSKTAHEHNSPSRTSHS